MMDSLRSIWNRMPSFRLLIPFMVGIGCYIAIPGAGVYAMIAVGVILLLALGVILYVNHLSSVAAVYQWRYASGVAMIVVMMAVGYEMAFFHTEPNDPHDIAHMDRAFAGSKAVWSGVISEPVVIREKTVSAVIGLQKAVKGDTSVPVSGHIQVSIARDPKSEGLRYGDRLAFAGEVRPYDAPRNPNQFDYGAYQALHHIHYTAYLSTGSWKVTETAQGNPLLSATYSARGYLLSLIAQCVPDANDLAVAAAIMLGVVDYETDDVKQAYAGSGVMHVLSVSGLHVAVLYFVLNVLLGWMDKRRRLQIAKGVIVIVVMMFYAVLTGLSPPTLRSVWMFGLITVARLLDRDVSIYNVLGVSCLCLLIWDPYYISDVGFQLSYIAVAGIVYLYPLFHGLLPRPSLSFGRPFGFVSPVANYLLDFTWGLVCVSIAAQIATCPISLYYFHNFPNYFLLSNLLVIPLSNFVLISGMVLFAVGWSHTLMPCAGWIFDHLLRAVNYVVFRVQGLPFSLSRDLIVNGFELIMLYAVIAMVCWFLADRRPRVLLAALAGILMMCTAFSMDSLRRDDHCELTVYSIPGRKAIALLIQRKAYCDFDTNLRHDEMSQRKNIQGHWSQYGIEQELSMDSARIGYPLPCGSMYMVRQKKILVMDKQGALPSGIKSDIVILSGNHNYSVAEIKNKVDCNEVVFDTSNKPWQVKRWIEECKKLNVKYHDCRDKAFDMDL